ncbi:MAG: hypothetical protein QOI64_1390, partial [Solirubrobacteraceae bacterium]|nr:hypothetical protein [Solirubrobacteraceae bacterium]
YFDERGYDERLADLVAGIEAGTVHGRLPTARTAAGAQASR